MTQEMAIRKITRAGSWYVFNRASVTVFQQTNVCVQAIVYHAATSGQCMVFVCDSVCVPA